MTTILRRFRDWRARIKRRLAARLDLLLEHLALRHQLMACERGRRICGTDRLGWCLLARFWSRWREPLTFVQPATVRRQASDRCELQALIQRMSAENRLWGSMRIVGVLRPLGFKDLPDREGRPYSDGYAQEFILTAARIIWERLGAPKAPMAAGFPRQGLTAGQIL